MSRREGNAEKDLHAVQRQEVRVPCSLRVGWYGERSFPDSCLGDLSGEFEYVDYEWQTARRAVDASIQSLADRTEADVFLCDEYRELATIHALLSTARLLTTPKLIEAFVRRGVLSSDEARKVLSETIDERSWRKNANVGQFMRRFEE